MKFTDFEIENGFLYPRSEPAEGDTSPCPVCGATLTWEHFTDISSAMELACSHDEHAGDVDWGGDIVASYHLEGCLCDSCNEDV
jgi:hypothetical protein